MKLHEPPDDDSKPWPFVRQVIHLETVDSTNNVAKLIAFEGREELPLVVWADRQTQGRGQRERTWWSDAGSLTFSLILDPRMHALTTELEPMLALTAAVAVCYTLLLKCGLCAQIRWPNDIELDGRKLGGILPERAETPSGVRLVIGIGLNLTTRLDHAPAEVRRLAASVSELMAPSRPMPEHAALLRQLLVRFQIGLTRLVRDGREFASEWKSLNYLSNQPVRVDVGPRIVTGICRAIGDDGALLVESDGELLRLHGGRVLRD